MYQRKYLCLFRAITDAIEQLGAPRAGTSIHMKELSFYWVWFGDISSTEDIVRRGPVVVSKQKQ